MKKFISVVLASVMVVAMAAGCSSSEKPAETPAETTEEGEGETGKVYNVCNLVNGNLGDKSFFDSAECRTYQIQYN